MDLFGKLIIESTGVVFVREQITNRPNQQLASFRQLDKRTISAQG